LRGAKSALERSDAARLREDGTLDDIAGWVAPIATMIAAMMTAANLGARITGWGFVVFTIGSVCWSIVGLASGQTNLVATNAFLTLVNLAGIWRWLGRQRAYEEGGKAAKEASRRSAVPNLFTATGIAGMAVVDRAGATVGKAVEALVECASGQVTYVVIATGGLGGIAEELRAVSRDAVSFGCDGLTLAFDARELCALAPLAAGDWPGDPTAAHGARA
jgi:hypothetical protein